ncbi:FAD-dependent oxidoreductase [Inmirania thermothiophila]|uniref:Choline dehydrogenase-like flavoprotein n=1 Tax=Inmirania thermothiophila TaxID=1750597 RepID=A0A3N1XTD0_9GAMM|nr:GMC family oxidoreductase [Inmirania thermothiophila]ROR29508.1 choline dehydrogenase-like flavoprotein [Inmirania thermothiophila]
MPEPVDVVVVGAGAGGTACAWRLASRGASVMVLESGPAYDPARDYRLHRPDWERVGFPEKRPGLPYTVAPLQPLDPAHDSLRSWSAGLGRINRTGRRQPVGYLHVRGVGGATLHFTGEAHRLHPDAFRIRSLLGVGADWPLGYEALEPYYDVAERIVGVAGTDPDPRCPRSRPYPFPPHPVGWTSRPVIAGLRRLGLGWAPNPLAVLPQPWDGRPACNYCAQCNRGCPRRDKGSADVTFARRAAATGRCRIVTGATVLRVLPDRRDRVHGVEYADEAGGRHRVRAGAVVLAAGAVFTPRLLLVSGLGNESGEVGRNFMETLSWTSAGLHPRPLQAHRGLPREVICWDRSAPDPAARVPGGFRLGPATAEAGYAGPAGHAVHLVAGIGRGHKRAMRERFGHALAVGAIGECLPNPGSFVDLDPEVRDAHGLPVARIHSRLDADALARLAEMAATVRAVLAAAGVEAVAAEFGSLDLFQSTHVFGTCRMGRDPRTSVVDDQGRSHRWRNLWIADASVFPSSGGGEAPSLTVEALAIRTADAILAAARG